MSDMASRSYGVLKPFNTGMAGTYPEGSPEASTTRISRIGGNLQQAIPFIENHPHTRVQRRPLDFPPNLASIPVKKIRLIKREHLQIWTSPNKMDSMSLSSRSTRSDLEPIFWGWLRPRATVPNCGASTTRHSFASITPFRIRSWKRRWGSRVIREFPSISTATSSAPTASKNMFPIWTTFSTMKDSQASTSTSSPTSRGPLPMPASWCRSRIAWSGSGKRRKSLGFYKRGRKKGGRKSHV